MRALSRTGVRFGLETLLIVATAIVTGVLHLGAIVIIASVVVAWAATSVFEYWRAHPRAAGRVRARREAEEQDEPSPEPSMPFEHVRVLPAASRVEPERQAGQVVVLEPETVFVSEPETDPEPTAEPAPVAVEAPTEIVRAVAAEAQPEPDPEPEPDPAPEPDPGPGQPEPAVVAAAAPTRQRPAAEWPQRAEQADPREPAAETAVIPLPVTTAPWSWNVWNLERVVRERDAANEELQFLLLYLRDYASPSGMLPPDFDGLVRESFGDLLAAPS